MPMLRSLVAADISWRSGDNIDACLNDRGACARCSRRVETMLLINSWWWWDGFKLAYPDLVGWFSRVLGSGKGWGCWKAEEKFQMLGFDRTSAQEKNDVVSKCWTHIRASPTRCTRFLCCPNSFLTVQVACLDLGESLEATPSSRCVGYIMCNESSESYWPSGETTNLKRGVGWWWWVW